MNTEKKKTPAVVFLSDPLQSLPYLCKQLEKSERNINTFVAYLCLSLLLSLVGMSQFMSGLGQVSVPFSQLCARLVKLSLEFLQLGGLAANFLLVRGQAPL